MQGGGARGPGGFDACLVRPRVITFASGFLRNWEKKVL